MIKVLMLSSSRAGQGAYLESATKLIQDVLSPVEEVLFIPYAGVTLKWDDYLKKVQQALPFLTIQSIHQCPSPKDALLNAKSIMVGGGNTFNLLRQLQDQGLTDVIVQRVNAGVPYVGWSAGANLCGNSIRTTNDMPIIQPLSFDALNLVPFQINPHYSDYQPPGHNGETRAERIKEFCALNPDMPVIGIREGSALYREGQNLSLLGELDGVLFTGENVKTITKSDNLSYLLNV
ncbi:MAG: dipeptidase PepE [Aliiglaciecola sp.]